MALPKDAAQVLSAIRLGWGLAELRGRNRPGAQPGDKAHMPKNNDHALPLRIERGDTELRIEVQAVVAALALELHVDRAASGTSFGAALDGQAKLLTHVRAPKACAALEMALGLLQSVQAGQSGDGGEESGSPGHALTVLQAGHAAQQAVVARLQLAVAAAEAALASARKHLAPLASRPGSAQAVQALQAEQAAAAAQAEAEASLRLARAAVAGEENGLAALGQVIDVLRQPAGADPGSTKRAAIADIQRHQHEFASAAAASWAVLADLIWKFDAHVQDSLTAASESQAIGYQLGRGLSETYWALDPGAASGPTSWGFLLGQQRCNELSRLVGRLSAHMNEYTPAAIAGSVEVWKSVAANKDWLGDDPAPANQDLYAQIRRWFELLILGQDPTTLIGPTAVMKSYRTIGRAIQLFWPQLAASLFGLAFLVTLLVLLNVGGTAAWAKALSAVLAAAGLSVAGLTGALKNSAQAMLKRLRQDAYTELVAIAVQTAPRPPNKRDIQRAISRRRLTTATPN